MATKMTRLLSISLLSLCLFYNVHHSASLSEEKLLPVILRSSKNATCNSQASDLLNSFVNGDEWAWRMVDANSKIPNGILMGNSKDMGNFDECVRISNAGNANINGKYCFAGISTLLPRTINISSLINNTLISSETNIFEFSILSMISKLHEEWGVSEQRVIDKIIRQNLGIWPFLRERILLNDSTSDDMIPLTLSLCLPDACLPSDLDLPSIFYATDDLCVTKDSFKVLDIYDYLAISFFVVIFVIMVISTIYDVSLSTSKKSPLKTILTSFSIYTNGKELAKTTRNPNHLLCLDGIKIISTLWVIMGHRFSNTITAIKVNTDDMVAMSEMMYSQYVQSALYAVDTFMVLSGCLMAYISLKSMSHLKQTFKTLGTFKRTMKIISFTLLAYLHRYLRLTPAIAALYIFTTTLVRHIGEGPLYHYFMDPQVDYCVNNWWSFFLYLENYIHPLEQCLGHLWYVDVDMQVFLLSPFILWPIVYYPKRMLYFGLPILTIIFCVVVFIITYVKELQWLTDDYMKYYYPATHTRLAAWFIGIGLGTILHNTRNTEFHIRKVHNILIWILVLTALVLLGLGQQDPSYNYERIKSSLWTTVNKPLWSLCICWIVWACVKGHGGIINSFLSCNFFQITSKLTFCMYLVHFILMIISKAEAKVPMYFDDINTLRLFFSDAVITIFVATIWTLAFEIPFRIIQKTLIGGLGPKMAHQSNVAQEHKNGDLSAELHSDAQKQ